MDYGRIRDYLYSLEPEPDERLEELRAYAEKERVPIIRRETESFLRRGRLQCRAWFQAQTEDGNTMFLDFQLKGAVTK